MYELVYLIQGGKQGTKECASVEECIKAAKEMKKNYAGTPWAIKKNGITVMAMSALHDRIGKMA